MRYRISEAEMDIMKILWERGPCRASEIACACKDRNGWEKNTSYTFLQRLVQKKAVRRREPGFLCTAAAARQEVCEEEFKAFLQRLYDGSFVLFLRDMVNRERRSSKEIDELKKIVAALD